MLAGSQAVAETPLERGQYLLNSISACGNCHTPRGPNGPLPGKELAGGNKFPEKPFTAYAANLTPDQETGIGRWTDQQLIAAIREGRRPDGSLIGPPMPLSQYRGISDNDVRAIVAYLRAATPVKNAVPKSEYRMPLPPSYGPPVSNVADVPRTDKFAYGAYLAGPLGHCIECHSSPGANGAPDFKNNLGGGGMAFNGPWGTSVAGNITPAGMARYSDADLKKIITTGIRPDGSKLKPPMAVPFYARMTDQDLDTLIAYLRSLPKK